MSLACAHRYFIWCGNYITISVDYMPSINWLKRGWWSLPSCCVAKVVMIESEKCSVAYLSFWLFWVPHQGTCSVLHVALLPSVQALMHTIVQVLICEYASHVLVKLALCTRALRLVCTSNFQWRETVILQHINIHIQLCALNCVTIVFFCPWSVYILCIINDNIFSQTFHALQKSTLELQHPCFPSCLFFLCL